MWSGGPGLSRGRTAVLGAGHVGVVTAVCLAELGHEVVGIGGAEAQVRELAAGHVPFCEPGLDGLLATALAAGRLSFTTDVAAGVAGRQVVFVCVAPYPDDAGHVRTEQVHHAVSTVVPHLDDGTVLAVRSAAPVGTARSLRALLDDEGGDRERPVALVCNPGFLRRGSAVQDFLHPDRIVLGGEQPALGAVASLYARVLTQLFPRGRRGTRPRLVLTDQVSAELAGHAASAFLAMKQSFANEVAAICEHVGADARQVTAAVGADHRIGGDLLDPGLGWGGSGLAQDIAVLAGIAHEHGEQAPLLRATVEVNEVARSSALRRLRAELKVLRGRRVAVLGLAAAPGTDDLSDSPALEVVRGLLGAGCAVSVHDPVVKDLPAELAAVRVALDAYDAARGAEAVVVATGWHEHVSLDLGKLARLMDGRVVLDGSSCLDPAAAGSAGLTLLQAGR